MGIKTKDYTIANINRTITYNPYNHAEDRFECRMPIGADRVLIDITRHDSGTLREFLTPAWDLNEGMSLCIVNELRHRMKKEPLSIEQYEGPLNILGS